MTDVQSNEQDVRAATGAGLVAMLRPLRAFVAGRLDDPHEVDDVVQETIARVLARQLDLDEDALTAYAFVVARNLIASHHRSRTRTRRHAHLLVDLREPDRPEELALATEERGALVSALSELPEPQRERLLVQAGLGDEVEAQRATHSSGAAAAQLARARARVRVDYLIALSRADLPTSRCRPVLLSLSAADRRRQSALRAGRHLVHCDVCARLAPALLHRDRSRAGLMAWLPFVGLLGWLKVTSWSRPAQLAAATGTATAVGVGAFMYADQPAPPPPPRAASTLETARGPLLPMREDMSAVAGEAVVADHALVLTVPADEGFWVGRRGARVWVQMSQRGESSPTLRSGKRVSFRGTVVRHDPGFARRVGVTAGEGAAELTAQRFHITVPARRVELTPR